MKEGILHWTMEQPWGWLSPVGFLYCGILLSFALLSFDTLRPRNHHQLSSHVWFPLLSYSSFCALLLATISHYFLLSPTELSNGTSLLHQSSGLKFIGWVLGFGFGIWSFSGFKRGSFQNWPWMTYAWIPGLILIRLGCLTGGCCHGIPALQGFCSLRYSSTYNIYHHHQLAGLIPRDSFYSAPLFPSQLLEIFFLALLWIALIYLIQKRHWFWQNSLLFSFWLYALFRFFTDFWKAGGYSWWIFENIHTQHFILLPLIVSGGIFLFRITSETIQHPMEALRIFNTRFKFPMGIWIGVSLCLIPLHNWARPGDFLFLVALQATALAALVYFFLKNDRYSVFRKALLPLTLSMILAFTGSSSSSDSARTAPTDSSEDPPEWNWRWPESYGSKKRSPEPAKPSANTNPALSKAHNLQAGVWGERGHYPSPCGGSYYDTRSGAMLRYTKLLDSTSSIRTEWMEVDYGSSSYSLQLLSLHPQHYAGGFQWTLPIFTDNGEASPQTDFVFLPTYLYLGNRNVAWFFYSHTWDSDLGALGVGVPLWKPRNHFHYHSNLEFGFTKHGLYLKPILKFPITDIELMYHSGDYWRMHAKVLLNFSF